MADVDLLYLVQWEDRFMSVISSREIVSPMQTIYHEGELITAKYQKRTYNAVISEIHPNRKFLLQQSKLPPKHSYVSKTSSHNSERRTQDETITVPSTVVSAPVEPPSLSVPATIRSAPVNQSGLSFTSATGSSPVNQSRPSVHANIGSSPVNQSSQPTSSTTGSLPVNQSGPSTHRSSTVNQSTLSVPSTVTVGCEPGLPGNSSKGSSSKEKRKESNWEEECRSLRKKLRKHEERIEALERSASDKTNTTPDDEKKAKDLVAHLAATDHNSVVQILSRYIFSENELRNCSRTGKKTVKCLSDVPRPSLDREKFSKLERLVMTKTSMPKDAFLKKFENFQKVLRRK